MIDAHSPISNKSRPSLTLCFMGFYGPKIVSKIKRNIRRIISITPWMLHMATFIVVEILNQPEISFFFFSVKNVKCRGKYFPLSNHIFWRVPFWMHQHLEADCKLTTLFQSNLLTSTLYPDSRQPDQSGRRHWKFRGWPHPYSDWLLLWGDGPSDWRWGDRTRDPCTGK